MNPLLNLNYLINYERIVANKSQSFKVTTQCAFIPSELKEADYHFKHHIFDDFYLSLSQN